MARKTTTTSHSSTSASSESHNESTSESKNYSESQSQSTNQSQSHSQSTSSGSSHSESRAESQSNSQSQSESTSQSSSHSESTTQKVLDEQLLANILAGLTQQMTDEQIEAYAENLLKPVLDAQIQASQQGYETARLSREQEIENLAKALAQDIQTQNSLYSQSRADVETDALARGMGRSSYTLQTLADQGEALAQAVRELTDESARKTDQIREQIVQAADQNAATQGRLQEEYAKNLAAKVQELKSKQSQDYNSNYLTAISAAMGNKTTSDGTQTGTQSGSSSTQTTGSQSSTQDTSNVQHTTSDTAQTGSSSSHTTGTQTGTQHTVGTQTSNSSSSTDSVSTTTSSGSGSSKSSGSKSSSTLKDVINNAAKAVSSTVSKLKK